MLARKRVRRRREGESSPGEIETTHIFDGFMFELGALPKRCPQILTLQNSSIIFPVFLNVSEGVEWFTLMRVCRWTIGYWYWTFNPRTAGLSPDYFIMLRPSEDALSQLP